MTIIYKYNIRRLRKSQKLTQGKLAVIIGLSRQQFNKWENTQKEEEFEISKECLATLAQALNCSVEDLINSENEEYYDDNDLKAARLKINLTQQQAADYFKISLLTLQKWEYGQSVLPKYAKKIILQEYDSYYDNNNSCENYQSMYPGGIKELRQRAGLTQKQLSDMFDIPKRTLQQWEEKKAKIPFYIERVIIRKLKNLNE